MSSIYDEFDDSDDNDDDVEIVVNDFKIGASCVVGLNTEKQTNNSVRNVLKKRLDCSSNETSQIIKKNKVSTSKNQEIISDVDVKKRFMDVISSILKNDDFYDESDDDVVIINSKPVTGATFLVEPKSEKRNQSSDLVQTVMSLGQFDDFSKIIFSPPSIDQIDRCKVYWGKASQFSTVVVKQFKVGFSGGDIDLLERHVYRHQPDMMLWDESICICMKLFQRLDDQLCLKSIKRRPSYFFESQFFYLKIFVQENLYKHSDVTNCFDKITKTLKCSIFDMDKLFFPINIDNYHWILIVVHIQQKTIQCYDSKVDINDDRSSRMKSLVVMLRHEALRQGICDSVEWKIIRTDPKHLLQQKNNHDCGVFTCIYALYLILGLTFDFKIKNIKSMRILMVLWFLDA